jgi:hypothetical protein
MLAVIWRVIDKTVEEVQATLRERDTNYAGSNQEQLNSLPFSTLKECHFEVEWIQLAHV